MRHIGNNSTISSTSVVEDYIYIYMVVNCQFGAIDILHYKDQKK